MAALASLTQQAEEPRAGGSCLPAACWLPQPEQSWLVPAGEAPWKRQAEICCHLNFSSSVTRILPGVWGSPSMHSATPAGAGTSVREYPTHSASCASASSVRASSLFLFLLFAFSLYFSQWFIILLILPSMPMSSRGVRGRFICRT